MATSKWDDSRFSVTSNQPSREQDARNAAVSSAAPPAALGSAHGDNRKPLARFRRSSNLYMLQTISVDRPETQSAAES